MCAVAAVAHEVIPGHDLAGGVRARRDRLPHRSARRRDDHAEAGRPSPAGEHRRGRGSLQRRNRTGRLPRCGGGGRRRQLLARRGGPGLRAGRRRRRDHRPRDRIARRRDPQAHGGRAGEHHHLAADRLRGLHSRQRDRRLGGSRGGHSRYLHGRARPEHHPSAHPAAGSLRLGHSRLPDQRRPVRAGRPRASYGDRLARGLLGRRPGRVRAGDQRRRRRHPHRVGDDGAVHHPRARPA